MTLLSEETSLIRRNVLRVYNENLGPGVWMYSYDTTCTHILYIYDMTEFEESLIVVYSDYSEKKGQGKVMDLMTWEEVFKDYADVVSIYRLNDAKLIFRADEQLS